ncbi:glycosyltransferase family 1 protein [Metabacillus bambusae]|uniref:Glycosyltransferase family 1 protein n=1 Tax=Metabacillus bambusae TaxID=2795218 RepID=A0ABS3N2E8_9BACI|nr:glycosyltransferase family 1 protein [Metabacillus bambusae]MBO1512353.1 glycosyltransferase family 1 protein [Metabacillus bambusae]
MSRISCYIKVGEVSLHLYQVIAGFILLERQGIIKLNIEIMKNTVQVQTPNNMVEVIINNDIRIIYDLNDGYDNLLNEDENYLDFMNKLLDRCDFYFKRSYSTKQNINLKHPNKIYPLGLNYMVTTSRNIAHRPFPLDPVKEKVKKLIRMLPFSEFYNGNYKLETFQDIPRKQSNPKILFMARLWEVTKEDFEKNPKKGEERKYINQVRAECIRLCQKEFGEKFFGGVNASPFSLENYSDIVISDKKITKRNNYLKKVKESTICISTMGLHESIGWKFGEYVAASKAIVSEQLHYELPGDFLEHKNYLSFNSPEQCVERIYSLLENENYRYQMMVDNFEYYHKYVRADRLILNSILTVLNKERMNLSEQNTHSIYAYI